MDNRISDIVLEAALSLEEEKLERLDSPFTFDEDSWKSVYNPQISLRQAFEILLKAQNGQIDPNLTVRQSASPIDPSDACFLVEPQARSKKGKKRRTSAAIGEESISSAISVKYQGFHHAEVYWASEHDFLKGVCARSMSKRRYPSTVVGKRGLHGFSGRLFSLLERSSCDRESEQQNSLRNYVVLSYSLVNFWRTNPRSAVKEISSDIRCLETESHSSEQYLATDAQGSVGNQTLCGSLRIKGDLIVDGDVSLKNLHVKGNLLVEGSMSGQLVTPPGAADYAEWFQFLNPCEVIEKGMVVQLRAPEQKITLDTTGDGPFLVVSTMPSIAAGVPFGGKAQKGALCAFIGQVPVKVKGKVDVGDFLFPSGKNDGYCISGSFADHKRMDALGTAMASSNEGDEEILAFVRWQHNIKWKILENSFNDQLSAIEQIWRIVIGPITFLHLVSLGFLYTRPDYVYGRVALAFRILVQLYVLFKYPYSSFIDGGHIYWFWVYDAASLIIDAVCLFHVLAFGSNEFGPVAVYYGTNLVCKIKVLESSYQMYNTVMNVKQVAQEQKLPNDNLRKWTASIMEDTLGYSLRKPNIL